MNAEKDAALERMRVRVPHIVPWLTPRTTPTLKHMKRISSVCQSSLEQAGRQTV